MNISNEIQLRKSIEDLDSQIASLEIQIQPLQDEISRLREARDALRRACEALFERGQKRTRSIDQSGNMNVAVNNRTARSSSMFTPHESYTIPILASIVRRGGRARRTDVLTDIEGTMAGTLTPADWECVPSGREIRWRTNASFQRKTMIQRGLLRDDSDNGFWEITPEGRALLSVALEKLNEIAG